MALVLGKASSRPGNIYVFLSFIHVSDSRPHTPTFLLHQYLCCVIIRMDRAALFCP